MNIYWHNFFGNYSVTGTWGWESFVWNHLRQKGAIISFPSSQNFVFPKVDVAFFYWRWSMPEPQYKERQDAYLRQLVALKHYAGTRTRIVIFDGDHKIMPHEIEMLSSVGADLYAPELKPRRRFQKLMYPSGMNELSWYGNLIEERRFPIGYIGNNYERYEQARRIFGGPDAPRSNIWGNWVDPGGTHRQPPEIVRADFPNATFHGRLEYANIDFVLKQTSMTVHLAKPSYCETGFVTMRWAEAAANGVFAAVPAEFLGVPQGIFPKVANQLDLAILEYSQRTGLANQAEWVYENMDVAAWSRELLDVTVRRRRSIF